MLKKNIKGYKIPTHIAFIMDGNRRWAKARGLDKMIGHRQGAIALEKIIRAIYEIKEIKYASFFGFSTENWNREKREIDYLFDISYNMLKNNQEKFLEKNMRFVSMGDTSRFPKKLEDLIKKVMNQTANNTGLTIFLGLNFGGRDDIVHAVKKINEKGEDVSIDTIKENLYCPFDIDLLIRTSGELRVSNFMLFQMAYSEFYFTKKHWPSFNEKDLNKAILAYSKRNRRFGGK